MQFEILNNSNSEPIWRWIFRKQDDLNQIVFIFLSLTNANNARYGPLFEFTSNVRIVYFKGLRCKYTDRVMLYVFKKFINILRIRINRYEVIHLLSLSKVFYNKIQVFHNDDPLYTNDELSELKLWQDANLENNRTPILICTNEYSFKWYSDVLLKVKIVIIEQGFYESMKPNSYIIADRFSCVYSSPYIHYGEDLHGNHTTWGANVLIDQIIPKLFKADPEIEVRLITRCHF
jgi:hypothetical protein